MAWQVPGAMMGHQGEAQTYLVRHGQGGDYELELRAQPGTQALCLCMWR